MKKSIIKVLSVVLVVVITLTSAPLSGLVGLKLPKWLDFSINASAETYSGTCGENLTWTFDDSTGTLTISGTGAMNNYSSSNRPWEGYEDNVKTVVMNNGVTTIGQLAFADCDILTSVIIPESVTIIYDGAFDECNSLKSLIIPNGVTTIGGYAFANCDSLTSVIIPDSVTLFGPSAFHSCDSLSSVVIGSGVKTIGAYAFEDCTSLVSVIIPNTLRTIGEYAFYNCDSLTDAYYLGSETQWNEVSIGFSNAPLLNVTIHYNIETGKCGGNLTWTFDVSTGTLTIFGTGAMYDYGYSNVQPWNNYKNVIKKVVISNGVTTIGHYAFEYYHNLTSVIIGNDVTTIRVGAFNGCRKLTSVTIPDSVTTLMARAFYYCDSLTKVEIGNSVTEIDDYAFAYCTTLTNIVIPDCVKTLGEWLFYMCYDLTSVKIGNGVKSIKEGTFSNCYDLNNITIPTSVTGIADSVFFSCDNLTDVYYSGTRNDWNKISINSSSNEYLSNATIHFLGEVHECSFNAVVTPPTCTAQGYTTYNCSVCGDTYTSNYVDALGHTVGDIIEENYVAPTCTETGSKDNVTYCTVCDAETSRKEIIIDATGHTEEEIPAVAPTCTETGLTVGVKCSACDEILTAQQELSANGHKYESVVTAPTCTEQGYTTYTCACGDSYVDDYTDTLGHDFENGTCTECNAADPEYFTFEIQNPSRTTIRCNDGIKLHTSITGNLPEGSRIEWSKNNSNFNANVSDSGNEITIISKNNGYTTFTATVYDADNKVIVEDTIEMYSKSGFFDKIGGFFRGLFGLTKIYEN